MPASHCIQRANLFIKLVSERDDLRDFVLNRFQVNFGMPSRILSPSPSLYCETREQSYEARLVLVTCNLQAVVKYPSNLDAHHSLTSKKGFKRNFKISFFDKKTWKNSIICWFIASIFCSPLSLSFFDTIFLSLRFQFRVPQIVNCLLRCALGRPLGY